MNGVKKMGTEIHSRRKLTVSSDFVLLLFCGSNLYQSCRILNLHVGAITDNVLFCHTNLILLGFVCSIWEAYGPYNAIIGTKNRDAGKIPVRFS